MKEITFDQFDELIEVAIKTVTDKEVFGGPWFATREDAENIMGDWFGDALEAILYKLGYILVDDEDEEVEYELTDKGKIFCVILECAKKFNATVIIPKCEEGKEV